MTPDPFIETPQAAWESVADTSRDVSRGGEVAAFSGIPLVAGGFYVLQGGIRSSIEGRPHLGQTALGVGLIVAGGAGIVAGPPLTLGGALRAHHASVFGFNLHSRPTWGAVGWGLYGASVAMALLAVDSRSRATLPIVVISGLLWTGSIGCGAQQRRLDLAVDR